MNRYFFFFILSVICLCDARSQENLEYAFEEMTDVIGENFIYDIAIDQNQNLWSSSRSGLYVYDGITSEEISDFRDYGLVENIEFDENNLLWFNTEKPIIREDSSVLQLYDPETKRFFSILDKFDIKALHKKKLENTEVFFIKNLKGDLYIFTDEHLFLKRKFDSTIEYLMKKGLGGFNFFNDLKLKKIDGSERYNIHNLITDEFITENPKANLMQRSFYHNKEIQIIAERKSKNQYEIILKNRNGDILNTGIESPVTQVDLQDYTLISFSNHIYKYHKPSQKTEIIDLTGTILEDNVIVKMRDAGDFIWLHTDNGLFRMYEKNIFFNTILPEKEYRVRKFMDLENDDLLIFTDKHLLFYNKKDNFLKIDEGQYRGENAFLWNDNTIHLSGFSSGLSRYEVNSNKREIKKINAKYIPHRFISSYDVDSIILLGIEQEFCILRGNTIDTISILKKGSISNFIEYDKESVFLIGVEGLNLFHIKSKRIRNFPEFENHSISAIEKSSISPTLYWVSTKYNGLLLWDINEGIQKMWNRKNGLSNNNIHCAYEDNKKRLWMSSDAGINILNIENNEITILNTKDGIPENEMNRYAHFKDKDGELFFGSQKGFIHFNPNKYEFKIDNTPLTIKYLKYLQKNSIKEFKIDVEKLPTNEIVINRNYITPSLILNPPRLGVKSEARYKIGKNNTWNRINGNEIPLNNISRTENLYVSRKISLNNWSIPELYILSVPPPFYKQPLFLGFFILLFFLSTILYLLNINNRRKKLNIRITNEIQEKTKELQDKNTKLQATNQLNDQIFSIISHDLRSPIISLNKVSKSLEYLVKNKEYDNLEKLGDSIQNNSKNVLGMVDNLLSWSKNQRQNIEQKETFNITKLVSEIIVELHTFISEKKVPINFQNVNENITVNHNKESIAIIVRNLISNAIKFSNLDQEINVFISQYENYFTLSVQDEGIGFDMETLESLNRDELSASRSGTAGESGLGLGLLLSKSLSIRMGGELTLGNNDTKGALVVLSLPYS